MGSVSFVVYGKAAPAGSKRAFVQGGRARVVDANPNAKPWQQQVAGTAIEAMNGAEPFAGAVSVEMTFYRRRPINHLRANGVVKESAPKWPTSKPDLLKIARGIEDSLTGICYKDDAAIVTEYLEKRYGEPERVNVMVIEL